jgi:ribosomal protein L32
MAVPKKKISYSKTRKKILAKKNRLNLYTQCIQCSNFIKLHRLCPSCSTKGNSLKQANSNFKTNINKLYETNF